MTQNTENIKIEIKTLLLRIIVTQWTESVFET